MIKGQSVKKIKIVVLSLFLAFGGVSAEPKMNPNSQIKTKITNFL